MSNPTPTPLYVVQFTMDSPESVILPDGTSKNEPNDCYEGHGEADLVAHWNKADAYADAAARQERYEHDNPFNVRFSVRVV